MYGRNMSVLLTFGDTLGIVPISLPRMARGYRIHTLKKIEGRKQKRFDSPTKYGDLRVNEIANDSVLE